MLVPILAALAGESLRSWRLPLPPLSPMEYSTMKVAFIVVMIVIIAGVLSARRRQRRDDE